MGRFSRIGAQVRRLAAVHHKKTPPGAGWPGGVFDADRLPGSLGQLDELVDIGADNIE